MKKFALCLIAVIACSFLAACGKSNAEKKVIKYFETQIKYPTKCTDEKTVYTFLANGTITPSEKALEIFEKKYGKKLQKPEFKDLNDEYKELNSKIEKEENEYLEKLKDLRKQRYKHINDIHEYTKKNPFNAPSFCKTKTPTEIEEMKQEYERLKLIPKEDDKKIDELRKVKNESNKKNKEILDAKREEIMKIQQKRKDEYFNDLKKLAPIVRTLCFEENGVSMDFVKELESDPQKMQEAQNIWEKHDIEEFKKHFK